MRGLWIFMSIMLLAGCDNIGSLTDIEYVNRAQESLDKGNPREAIIDLKNALRENPQNTQARWLLGNAYVDTGDGPSAEKELTRARELGVADDSVIPVLARSLIQQRKYREVLALDSQSGLSDEAAANLMASRGLAYLLLGETENAISELDKALRTNPDSAYVNVEVARLSINRRDYERARRHLDRALEIEPQSDYALSILGDFEQLEGNTEAALEAYSRAIDYSHNKVRDLLKRAMLYFRSAQYDKAQEDTDRLKGIAKGHPEVDFMQGLVYLAQDKPDKANELFNEVNRKYPNHPLITYYLGTSHFMLGNLEQADRQLALYLEDNSGSVTARKLHALVKLKLKDFRGAEQLVRPVVNARPDDVIALNILADSLLYQNRLEELAPISEKIAELRPDSARAKTRMAVGLLMQGKDDAGIDTLESAIEIDPQFQSAEMLLVLHHLRTKSYEQAEQAAGAFAEKHPDSALAHNLRGKVYLARGQVEQASQALERAREISPGDPYACRNLALIALGKSNTDEARKLLNEVLEHNEGYLPTMSLLAALEQREGEFEAMKVLLNEAIDRHPDAVTPRVLLAQQYLAEGKPDQALAMLDEVTRSRNRNNPLLLNVLGQAQLDAGEFEQAELTFRDLVKLIPDSPQTRFQLARAYGGLNDRAAMKHELQKTLELQPDHLLAGIALTRISLQEGDMEGAKQQLASLKSTAPNAVDVMKLEGEILIRSGEPEKALEIYQTLFEVVPDTRNLLRLTLLQWQMEQRETAISGLEGWLAEHPSDTAARRSLASYYMQTGRRDLAMQQYEEVLRISARDPIVLNDMAWHLRESDPDRALELADRAHTIAPKSASIMDTLVVILIERGDTRRAERVLEEAMEIAPDSPTLHYRRAMLLDTRGETKQAIAELSLILEKKQDFPERADAEAMMQRLRGS